MSSICASARVLIFGMLAGAAAPSWSEDKDVSIRFIRCDGKTCAALRGGSMKTTAEIPEWAGNLGIKKVTIKSPGELFKVVYSNDDSRFCCAFSPDLKTLATGHYNKSLLLINAGSAIISGLKGGVSNDMQMDDNVKDVAYSPDGKFLACAAGSNVVIIELSTMRRSVLKGHQTNINAVCFSSDSRLLASCDAFGEVRIWNVFELKEELALREYPASKRGDLKSVSFSPDNRFLVAGGRHGRLTAWKLYDKSMQSFDFNKEKSRKGEITVAFMPEKDWALVAVDSDMYRVGFNGLSQTWMDVQYLSRYPADVESMCFSDSGRLVVCAQNSRRGGLAIWDFAGEHITLDLSEAVSDCAFATRYGGDWIAVVTPKGARVIQFDDINAIGRIIVEGDELVSYGAGNVSFDPERTLIVTDGGENYYLPATGDVDFSYSMPVMPPYAVARAELVSSGAVNAGEKVEVKLMIDNKKGKGDICRLVAVTECGEVQSLSNNFLAIGRVKAGEEISRVMTLAVGKDCPAADALVRFRFLEANDFYPEPVELKVAIKSAPKPDFAVSVQVFDGQGGKGVGNGDGILQLRESPEITITTRNVGGAAAEKAYINISNIPSKESGIDVFGSLTAGFRLGAGDTFSHSFQLSLKPVYKDDKLVFNVVVGDETSKIRKEEKIELVIGKPTERKAIAMNRVLQVSADKTSIYTGASRETDIMGLLPQGAQVVAKAWLGDFYQIDLGQGQVGWVEVSKVTEITRNDNQQVINYDPPKIVLESDRSPIVAVVFPESGYMCDESRIKVRGFARDDKDVKKLVFKVNGKASKESELSGRRVDFSEELQLADGLNKIEVVAEDSAGKTDMMCVEVKYLGQFPILKGYYKNIWAVIIGVDKFKNSSVPPLKYAVRDAKGVEKLLREKVVAGKIITLYNEEATKENILQVLQGELSEAGKEDAVFVYMACHGLSFSTEKGALGDLIPYDGSFSEKERYKNISMQIFKDDIAKGLKAKHMLVVVDACYGGVLTRGVGIKKEDVEGLKKDTYLKDVKDKEAKIVITAGADNEEVLDKGPNDHSVFTGRLIELVDSSRHFIGAKELFGLLKSKVEEDAARRNHKQTPQFGYWWGDGDFIFIKK